MMAASGDPKKTTSGGVNSERENSDEILLVERLWNVGAKNLDSFLSMSR